MKDKSTISFIHDLDDIFSLELLNLDLLRNYNLISFTTQNFSISYPKLTLRFDLYEIITKLYKLTRIIKIPNLTLITIT